MSLRDQRAALDTLPVQVFELFAPHSMNLAGDPPEWVEHIEVTIQVPVDARAILPEKRYACKGLIIIVCSVASSICGELGVGGLLWRE